jgi:sugar phosphate isomerase/epimerase
MHERVCISPVALGDTSVVEQIGLLRRIGARRAGFYTHFLGGGDGRGAVTAIAESGIDVAYLVHRIGPFAQWRRSRKLLEEGIEVAAELGAPFVYFTTGAATAHRFDDCVSELGERLRPVQRRARAVGVDLAVENTHALRSDLSFAFSYRDAVRVARQVDMAVVLDLFGAWIEPDLAQTVAGSLDILAIVQVSDFVFGTSVQPNRWVPGDGDIPLAPILADLLTAGYRGLFDIELHGAAIEAQGAEAALARGAGWLTQTLDGLGPGSGQGVAGPAIVRAPGHPQL